MNESGAGSNQKSYSLLNWLIFWLIAWTLFAIGAQLVVLTAAPHLTTFECNVRAIGALVSLVVMVFLISTRFPSFKILLRLIMAAAALIFTAFNLTR